MSSNFDFITFVCDQIAGCGTIRYRKMFGEYMVYVNDKPILLVCDNTVYIKKLDALKELMVNADCGFPYEGSKEHYILEIDNSEFSKKIVDILEPITMVPKKKKKKVNSHELS